MLPVRHKVLKCLLLCLFKRFEVVELQFGFEEETNRPEPFRSVVVVEPMRSVWVDVVSVVLLIRWVESFDTHASVLHEDTCNMIKTNFGMLWLKQVTCHRHGNTEIRPKLIIRPSRPNNVFVNSSALDVFAINGILRIFLRCFWDPKLWFKVRFYLICPRFVIWLELSQPR